MNKPKFIPTYALGVMIPTIIGLALATGLFWFSETLTVCSFDEDDVTEEYPTVEELTEMCLKSFNQVRLTMLIGMPLTLLAISLFKTITAYRYDTKAWHWGEGQKWRCYFCFTKINEENFCYFVPEKKVMCLTCGKEKYGEVNEF